MSSFKGRDFLLKIGNGGAPETFATLGAARANALSINNAPVDATSMEDAGIQVLASDAGVQSLQIAVEGLFKDTAAEETLRAAAFARTQKNFQLLFPNGDMYQAAFVVQDYNRGGSYDDVETFSVTLARSGAGSFTAAS